jgi:hypothetical protein
MPDALWTAAARAADTHGVWAVSRALRVNYDSLKERVERLSAGDQSSAARFVELDAASLIVGAQTPAVVIELSRRDGAMLTVRLQGESTQADLTELAREFLDYDR